MGATSTSLSGVRRAPVRHMSPATKPIGLGLLSKGRNSFVREACRRRRVAADWAGSPAAYREGCPNTGLFAAYST